MGMVTDIFWTCPGCGSREKAQAYGGYDDPDEFPVDAVPASRGLKWNPPCGQCGHYRLVMPEVMVACIPVAFPGDEGPNGANEGPPAFGRSLSIGLLGALVDDASNL